MDANRTAAEELAALHSSREQGLSSAEASIRLKRDGANEIAQKKQHPLWLLLKKFWGVSAWMIELVALLSLALKKYNDVWMALLLLVINALLSFLQEQLLTFTFQLLLFFALFSLLSIRERRAFWKSRPSIALMASFAAGVLIGILIGRQGLGRLQALPLSQSLLMAGCVGILVLGLNDAVKVALVRRALQKMHHPLSKEVA